MSLVHCLQSNPAAVSRGVSQPDRASDEPPDLFSEEAAGTPAKSNGVHSDDDSDLFAGDPTVFHPQIHILGLSVALLSAFSVVTRVIVGLGHASPFVLQILRRHSTSLSFYASRSLCWSCDVLVKGCKNMSCSYSDMFF